MRMGRRRFENKLQKILFFDYWALVCGEKERSERHNRFFILFGLTVDGFAGKGLVELLQNELRSSDYVFVVKDSCDPFHNVSLKLGILLPETDLQGAEIVKERLATLFRVNSIPIQMKQAVYPDDATEPEQLLKMAFGNALSIGTV